MPHLVVCPACAADVSSNAPACPRCGEPDPGRDVRDVERVIARADGRDEGPLLRTLDRLGERKPPPPREAALTAGWVCLGVYVAASILLPFVGAVMLSPLPIAAGVLGIVAAARGRVLSGVVVVVLACVAGLVACGAGFASLMVP